MLQQFFNDNTFKLEEKIYVSEGIKFAHVDYINNEPMIELITARRHGILAMLDEECVLSFFLSLSLSPPPLFPLF